MRAGVRSDGTYINKGRGFKLEIPFWNIKLGRDKNTAESS
jgi:hypothetical protein